MTLIRKIYIGAFLIRLIALAFVITFSESLTTGFIGSGNFRDDVRYLNGAEIYAKSAKSIIDYDALADAYLQVGDWSIDSGYSFVLWYWIVSISMYIFHTHIALRIMNIIFAILSIKCIYDITQNLYGEKTAKYAALLYSFLPYPVFFSCFLYKDQLYTLVILIIFRIITLKNKNITIIDFALITFWIIVSTFLRSGLSVFIAFLIFYLYINAKGFSLSSSKVWIILVFMCIGSYFLYQYNVDSIDTKFNAYIENYEEVSKGIISYIYIKSFDQIYKYPIALFFMMLLPIKTTSGIHSWGEVVSSINFVVMPIAFGCLCYIFNWKIKKNAFFWSIQLLFLITIMTSLGLFRHSYYLQPYTMIFFSHYLTSLKDNRIFIALSIIVTFCYTIMLYF